MHKPAITSAQKYILYTPDIPEPYSKSLEELALPNAQKVVDAVLRILGVP